MEGCVAFGGFSYRVPDGTSLSSVTVDDHLGNPVEVRYAVLEGWETPTCTGAQPRATIFFPSEVDGYDQFQALDVLYSGNCSCGYILDATIEGLGTGVVYLLDR